MNILERIFDIIATFVLVLLNIIIAAVKAIDELVRTKERRKREKAH